MKERAIEVHQQDSRSAVERSEAHACRRTMAQIGSSSCLLLLLTSTPRSASGEVGDEPRVEPEHRDEAAEVVAEEAGTSPPGEESEQRSGDDDRWLFVTTVGRLFDLVPSVDPDEPRLGFLFGRRMEGMAGGQMIIFGRRSERLDASMNLAGFIALINFGEHQAMPWQSFRGNFGLSSLWRSRWLDERILPTGGTFVLDFGFFHESDHAVDVDSFEERYLVNPDALFDNGNFSSFEYFKLRLRYQQTLLDDRIIVLVSVGGRFFTPSIDPWNRRALRAAFLAEARVSFRLVRRLYAFLGIFYELLANGFTSVANNYVGDLDRTPLHYLIAETGLSWRSRGGQAVVLSALFSRSHGRGLDFAELRTELGCSLRFHL